jgi:hypothetical protein
MPPDLTQSSSARFIVRCKRRSFSHLRIKFQLPMTIRQKVDSQVHAFALAVQPGVELQGPLTSTCQLNLNLPGGSNQISTNEECTVSTTHKCVRQIRDVCLQRLARYSIFRILTHVNDKEYNVMPWTH